MADLIDYVFQFPDQGAAGRDLIVGPYSRSKAGGPFEILVFEDVTQNSVTPLPGFWLMIATTANDALAGHPNVQLVNNRTLYSRGQPSVISSNLPTAHIAVMFSTYGTYIPNGLSAA